MSEKRRPGDGVESPTYRLASRLANRVGKLEKELATKDTRLGELAHEVRCLKALLRDAEPPEKDLAVVAAVAFLIEPGSRWRHRRTGNVYAVDRLIHGKVGLTNDVQEWVPGVVYRTTGAATEGRFWWRTSDDFLRAFEHVPE